MRRFAGALWCSLSLPAAAVAGPAVDGGTECRAIVGYLDSRDGPNSREAFAAAKKLVGNLDAAAVAQGRKSYLAALPREKEENMYILVVVSCRDTPQQTLGQVAAAVYEGLATP